MLGFNLEQSSESSGTNFFGLLEGFLGKIGKTTREAIFQEISG